MRRGSEDVFILTLPGQAADPTSQAVLIGLSLGWDFCAEHEWGIAELKRFFGIPERITREQLGVDARTNTLVPAGLKFFENLEGFDYLMFSDGFRWIKPAELTAERFDQMLGTYDREDGLGTAWDGSSFGVRMKSGLETNILRPLHEAFARKDVIIYFAGKGGPFNNQGLALVIRSRVPAAALETFANNDKEYLDLMEASEKTGITAKLKAAGKRYFACSPQWAKDFKDRGCTTSHPVIYWLNPQEQDGNNFGWFTVEDLLAWIEGTGPIPKTARSKATARR